eukprot:scaffold6726_cov95-Skeletonema_dohrnii-CCMP3373.AAC.1
MLMKVQVKMKILIVAICVVEGSEQDPVEGRGEKCGSASAIGYVDKIMVMDYSYALEIERTYINLDEFDRNEVPKVCLLDCPSITARLFHSYWAKVKVCSFHACLNRSRKGGVCRRHGADIAIKLCSSEGGTNQLTARGVCRRHGAKRKLCSSEGCTNNVVKGRRSMLEDGAEVKLCKSAGCTQRAQNGG